MLTAILALTLLAQPAAADPPSNVDPELEAMRTEAELQRERDAARPELEAERREAELQKERDRADLTLEAERREAELQKERDRADP